MAIAADGTLSGDCDLGVSKVVHQAHRGKTRVDPFGVASNSEPYACADVIAQEAQYGRHHEKCQHAGSLNAIACGCLSVGSETSVPESVPETPKKSDEELLAELAASDTPSDSIN